MCQITKWISSKKVLMPELLTSWHFKFLGGTHFVFHTCGYEGSTSKNEHSLCCTCRRQINMVNGVAISLENVQCSLSLLLAYLATIQGQCYQQKDHCRCSQVAFLTPIFLWFCRSICDIGHIQSVIFVQKRPSFYKNVVVCRIGNIAL